MNTKKMLSKEIRSKFRGYMSEKIVSQKVDQFFKYGNTFLLLELISMKQEIQSLREILQSQNKKTKYLSELIVT